ncbi:amino acid ABC transporter permease [Alsobacter soli]|uniref:Amino acid ABC transporter permease n=1 Tax=Alsobacter soli TaxID=2109933 RepID=A0A2T1HQ99_9HYPH|nr:amino acid ABC transporter permease [Alsobacter soli]PSC03834.1 amino acid ABC transporter permease [Alsobacter soli]
MRTFTSHDILFLLQAARWTLALSLLAFVGGGLGGAILAVGRISRVRALRSLASLYIQVVQGTPLLIQLFIWYFGISLLGADLSPIVAAAIALTLYSSAFFAEIWRGAIQSIAKGQWESASSLGLTRFETLWYVILPQSLRPALPPTVGFMVQIVKNTSLAALVGFVELARAGQLVNNITFQPLPVFACVAVIYFAICFPLSALSRWLERRTHGHRQLVRGT